jgi:DNA-binding SARP family transcriptional activator
VSETARSPDLAGIRLGLLGSFSLSIDAEPIGLPMNAQRLVCFLALHDGSLLRPHVAGSLWGDTTEAHAAGSLRSALWRLRHPEHSLVLVGDSHLQLDPAVIVDLHASEALAQRILDESHDLDGADLDEALLSEDVLHDWTEDWVLVKREHHTQLRLRALDALCRRLTQAGRFGHAVQTGKLAVSVEPLRESAQRTLIAAHLAEGNIGEAMKQYDSFRDLLRRELNLEPSAEMRHVIEGASR